MLSKSEILIKQANRCEHAYKQRIFLWVQKKGGQQARLIGEKEWKWDLRTDMKDKYLFMGQE